MHVAGRRVSAHAASPPFLPGLLPHRLKCQWHSERTGLRSLSQAPVLQKKNVVPEYSEKEEETFI
jgi:hypothetical protein